MNDTERDTMLAALRAWQELIPEICETNSHLWMLATNGGEHDALTHEEIDELCERLNVSQEDTGILAILRSLAVVARSEMPDEGQDEPDIIEKWKIIEAADDMIKRAEVPA